METERGPGSNRSGSFRPRHWNERMVMSGRRKTDSVTGDGGYGDSGKKPRAKQTVLPDGVVKEERGEVSQGGSEGDGGVAAVEAMGEPQICFTMAVSLFHCQPCILPLKPPTFKCEVGHVVCCTCRGTHGQACGRAATFAACRELDAVVLDAKLPCQYAEFGCRSLVVYHQAADHHAACPWAPCFCPARGCGFFSSPARLAEHFAAHHRWPVTRISYGVASKLPVPAPPRGCGCHVLVADEDRSVFLVSGSALSGVTAVSLVCVRANGGCAAAGVPQFKCKLSVELPSNKDKLLLIMSAVGSDDLSGGFPAPDQNMFLAVPPVFLYDASGEASQLVVCIEKADATAANSTQPSRCSSPDGCSSSGDGSEASMQE